MRDKHKHRHAAAILVLLAPLAATAVGIGEIGVHSALHQNFDAEIPLSLAPGESLNGLRVSLGSAEAFAKAGIERPSYLANFRFELANKAGGAVIRVTSPQAVEEIFLSFLVELSGPQGPALRKFTVALDPPAPPRFRPPGNATKPAVDVPPHGPATAIATPAQGPRQAAGGANRYGPVKRGETLWVIAGRVSREQGIPLRKALSLLHVANPRAFVKGRRNAIKVGAVLSVPHREALPKDSNQPLAPRPTTPGGALTLLSPRENRPPRAATEPPPQDKEAEAAAQSALELAYSARQGSGENRSRLALIEQQMVLLQRTLVSNAAKMAAAPAATSAKPAATATAPSAAAKPSQAAETVKPVKAGKRRIRHHRRTGSKKP